MAFVVTTDAATAIGAGTATLNGHWSGAIDPPVTYKFLWGYDTDDTETTETENPGAAGSGSYVLTDGYPDYLTPDRVVRFSFRARQYGETTFVGGGQLNFKSYAELMEFGTPGTTAIGDTWADTTIDFNPRTFESTATVKVQYKLDSEPLVWTDGNDISGLWGDGVVNLDITITGLLANTAYDYRFVATRDTANDTGLVSAEGSFTTAEEPAGDGDVMWLG